MLSDKKCSLIDDQKEHIKSSIVDVKAVKLSKSILAPFLCCAKCKMLYTWYKLINGKWVNQSGYRVATQHSMKCASGASGNIKRYFEPKQQEVPKSPPTLTNEWQKKLLNYLHHTQQYPFRLDVTFCVMLLTLPQDLLMLQTRYIITLYHGKQ